MVNKKIVASFIIFLLSAGLIGTFLSQDPPVSGESNQITDMLGRTVPVPSYINKVYSLSSSTTVQLYMLAPDKMVGWDSARGKKENQYMPREYQSLPVLGGGKKDANYESIISSHPDIILVGHGGTVEVVEEIQHKFGQIPVLDVEGDNNLTSIIPSIEFMGSILQEPEKARKLINFHDKVLSQVNGTIASIPEDERKKVYYGKDPDGLKTYAPGAQHANLITMCGGKNVVEAPITKGGVGVSMELILKWNPEVIITSDAQFYESIYSHPQWKNIEAVRNKEVYLVPPSPFNWFEGPPGANTIMGIPWTAKVVYPDQFKDLDIKSLTKEFYAEFYHYNLTDDEVTSILRRSGLKEF
ncbi:MAG: ABC transporter substrate-binding protein [Euryarchaeota archaeon]|nr:ABC transporter substrate-binding protein [Euryarchaeota archaeon]MBU4607111.1 ABC transporter substrate-binding protein [Euryarchaeota archaeon]MBV1729196.1 ABC transporter substrate-binding protein [Methanobacterium sp.]MBV1755653.1 ABC transporter substrate-binding protein [Methanobacterium sp.]